MPAPSPTLPPVEHARRITLQWLAALSWRLGCAETPGDQELVEQLHASNVLTDQEAAAARPS